MSFILFGVILPWLIVGLFIVVGSWIGFQLVHQNGRLLAHLEALERRLAELSPAPVPLPNQPPVPSPSAQPAPAPGTPAGLPIGSPAPEFELPRLDGSRRSLSSFRGQKLLLIFFNPRCGFCTQMAPELAALPARGEEGYPIPLVVTTGEAEVNRKLVEEYGLRCPVLLQHEMEVAAQYQCHGTPMGYLIDEQGKIASELAVGAQALLALARVAPVKGANDPEPAEPTNGHGALRGKHSVEESKINRNGLPAGTPAPDFRLPLLHGGELSLEEYRGRKVLLVFSDPKCGPCNELSAKLEQQARRGAGIQVLMVSRGELEANRAKAAEHGLTFPIVLQRQWEISREYGMFATPVGYLIDEEGVIARDVAVGVEPILSLLSAPVPPTNGKVPVPQHGKEPVRRR